MPCHCGRSLSYTLLLPGLAPVGSAERACMHSNCGVKPSEAASQASAGSHLSARSDGGGEGGGSGSAAHAARRGVAVACRQQQQHALARRKRSRCAARTAASAPGQGMCLTTSDVVTFDCRHMSRVQIRAHAMHRRLWLAHAAHYLSSTKIKARQVYAESRAAPADRTSMLYHPAKSVF